VRVFAARSPPAPEQRRLGSMAASHRTVRIPAGRAATPAEGHRSPFALRPQCPRAGSGRDLRAAQRASRADLKRGRPGRVRASGPHSSRATGLRRD
jgi:hypothetical protein